MEPDQQHIDETKAFRIAYLIAGFIRDNLTIDEQTELDAWVLAGDDNMFLFEKLTDQATLAEFRQWLDKSEKDAHMGTWKCAIEFFTFKGFSHNHSINERETCLLIGGFLHFHFNSHF